MLCFVQMSLGYDLGYVVIVINVTLHTVVTQNKTDSYIYDQWIVTSEGEIL